MLPIVQMTKALGVLRTLPPGAINVGPMEQEADGWYQAQIRFSPEAKEALDQVLQALGVTQDPPL